MDHTELTKKEKKEIEKKKAIKKFNIGCSLILLLLLGIFIAIVYTCSKNEQSVDFDYVKDFQKPTFTDENVEVDSSLIKHYTDVENIEAEIQSIKDYDINNIYKGTLFSLKAELYYFSGHWNSINNYEEYQNKETEKYIKIYKNELKKLQKRQFPKIRKQYYKVIKEKFWLEDIYVTISGSNYTHLNFTGSIFVNNRNIKDFQDLVNETFLQLRFKFIYYRWYKGQDDYTYYSITSVKDEDPVSIELDDLILNDN